MDKANTVAEIDTVEDLHSATEMFAEYTRIISENGKPLILKYAPNYTADGVAVLMICEQ